MLPYCRPTPRLSQECQGKERRKNARDTQRFRKRRRTLKMQAVLAEAQKMILNKSSIELDDHDKALLCKGLRFAPTHNWSQSFENAEWLNVQQHVRRTEWSAVLGEKIDGDFVLPKKLKISKFSRPESGKNDEETKTYVEMVCTKLRNIKPLVLKSYRTKNNLSKEQRKSFSKLAKLTEERKIVICQADKDGKIVILNYDNYDAIMTREIFRPGSRAVRSSLSEQSPTVSWRMSPSCIQEIRLRRMHKVNPR